MIKFELANPYCRNSEGAVVYYPGQDYVMFNGVKIKLDRVLCVNDNWVGCVFGRCSSINFIERRSGGGVVVHSVKTVDASSGDREQRISTLRMKQAAVLLKAAKRASECVGDLGRLIRAFDCEAEDEDGVKLGIADFIRKRKECVPLDDLERTLQMVEKESIEIIHEELDIPAPQRKRLRP